MVLYSGASSPKNGIDAAPSQSRFGVDAIDMNLQRIPGLGAFDVRTDRSAD